MKQIAFKFIILGDGGVGKTTLLHKFVTGNYLDVSTMTIGVEILTKEIKVGSLGCQLMLWDISGQERFRFMIDRYMKGASAALFLFDITSLKSLNNIGQWIKIIKKYYDGLPIILVATKCDLAEFAVVSDEDAEIIKKHYGLVDYIKTSAKLGLNINVPFEELAIHVANLRKLTITTEKSSSMSL